MASISLTFACALSVKEPSVTGEFFVPYFLFIMFVNLSFKQQERKRVAQG